MEFIDQLTDHGRHSERAVPDLVFGRHLQLDADISCYEAAYIDESLEKNINNLKLNIETARLMAGATMCNMHLTMDKKGREHIAMVKEYQANRQNRDPELKARVWELRHFLSTYETPTCFPYPWTEQEADDGMAQFQVLRIRNTRRFDLSVIMTTDKDLNMVPGMHIHQNSFVERTHRGGYGHCDLLATQSGKLVKGIGTSFFWHQMLMGDGADNIPGLPWLSPGIMNKYFPTKAIRNAKSDKTRATLCLKRPAGLCGAVTAHKLLLGITSDHAAYERVLECYEGWYTEGTFATWRGDIIACSPKIMLIEQARLLWMKRTLNEDVKDWLEEIDNGAGISYTNQ